MNDLKEVRDFLISRKNEYEKMGIDSPSIGMLVHDMNEEIERLEFERESAEKEVEHDCPSEAMKAGQF